MVHQCTRSIDILERDISVDRNDAFKLSPPNEDGAELISMTVPVSYGVSVVPALLTEGGVPQ